jgi:hypothetical protein
MRIYIASSWRNEHGVQMLTEKLRALGCTVISWVENNYGEQHNHVTKKFSFSEWLHSTESDQLFAFDVNGAAGCDLFIMYQYAGSDAHAEMGVAWAKGVPIIGLMQKGADLGLMSKMVGTWCTTIEEVLQMIQTIEWIKETRFAPQMAVKAFVYKDQVNINTSEKVLNTEFHKNVEFHNES